MIKKIKIPFCLLALFVGTGVWSCQNEIPGYPDFSSGDRAVKFGVSIEDTHRLNTRADEEDDNNTGNGLDSVYVAIDPWDTDFYVQLNTQGENGEEIQQYGTYIVESGYEGRLAPKTPEDQLDWQSINTPHTFYSWTVPWMTTAQNANTDAESSGAEESNEYVPSDSPVDVHFYNSSEQSGYYQNFNNAILEKFIGAKSNSYTYTEHGKYVSLTYHHLVSKIKVDNLILIESNGAIREDLQADMTFLNMPVKATFYPHPKKNDPSGAPENWRPYVGAPYEESPDTGVTYYIWNYTNIDDIFYICPEVDFSNIDYQIKINSEQFQHYDTYYGNFNDVIFERKSNYQYDGQYGNNDEKILHAGEEMHITITLIPGIGPGLKVIIEDWSVSDPRESEYHPFQGFYTDAEVNAFLDLLFSFDESEYYQDPPSEALQLLFDMYGYEKDGKKYFPLYSNVTAEKGGKTSNIFPVPNGFIIDGMGHTITLSLNSGNYFGTGKSEKYYNIGPCRDVYLSDPNGENTIYIDSDGFVWITNPLTGQLEITDNQLPELKDGEKGYDISAESGKVRPTKYFNDKVTG